MSTHISVAEAPEVLLPERQSRPALELDSKKWSQRLRRPLTALAVSMVVAACSGDSDGGSGFRDGSQADALRRAGTPVAGVCAEDVMSEVSPEDMAFTGRACRRVREMRDTILERYRSGESISDAREGLVTVGEEELSLGRYFVQYRDDETHQDVRMEFGVNDENGPDVDRLSCIVVTSSMEGIQDIMGTQVWEFMTVGGDLQVRHVTPYAGDTHDFGHYGWSSSGYRNGNQDELATEFDAFYVGFMLRGEVPA